MDIQIVLICQAYMFRRERQLTQQHRIPEIPRFAEIAAEIPPDALETLVTLQPMEVCCRLRKVRILLSDLLMSHYSTPSWCTGVKNTSLFHRVEQDGN